MPRARDRRERQREMQVKRLGEILADMNLVPLRTSAHARGFPGFGPPTMCGEGEPPTEAVVEVTCERCIEIHSSAETLMARAKELHEQGWRAPVFEAGDF